MENVLIVIIAAILLLAALAAIMLCVRKISRVEAEKTALSGEKSELEGRLKMQAESQKAIAEEREKVFESQRKQMEEAFKLLSEQNSAGLRRQNAESITELLKPIQDKFGEFDKTVRENQKNSVAQDASLRELLKAMSEQSRSVGEEAKNLANALTGRSKVQGDFGEMLLVDLLKGSGLEEGTHFISQGVIRDELGHEVRSEVGAAMIPDVIVYYPDDTEVIIDSKVSLAAYVNYVNATTVEDREKYAKEHIASVTRHIDELKTKDYASYIQDGKKKVDYNIMFIPMEGAFRLMLEAAPTLWKRAKDARVLIVSQMNLMIVLNMILMSWKQHDQEKNIAEVYKTASELMGQLQNWMDSYVRLGDFLGKAQSAYDDSKKKLTDSSQSVIRKIDKLEKMKLFPKRSTAKIKAGTRISGGQESIIPQELADGLDNENSL